MWVRRTPEEVERWHAVTLRDARSHGFWIAALLWLALVVFGMAGFHFTRAGVIINHGVRGSLLVRAVFFAVFVSPICGFVYRAEVRKELANSGRRSLCPRCGAVALDGGPARCGCGEPYLPQCALKWVEDE